MVITLTSITYISKHTGYGTTSYSTPERTIYCEGCIDSDKAENIADEHMMRNYPSLHKKVTSYEIKSVKYYTEVTKV